MCGSLYRPVKRPWSAPGLIFCPSRFWTASWWQETLALPRPSPAAWLGPKIELPSRVLRLQSAPCSLLGLRRSSGHNCWPICTAASLLGHTLYEKKIVVMNPHKGFQNVRFDRVLHEYGTLRLVKVALSELMLCTLVFIFTSGSSALLARHVVVYRSDYRYLPYSIHFSEFWQFFSRENGQNTKILKSAIFVLYKNGRRRLLGVQSI